MSCYGGQGQGLVHSQPFHLLHERQKDDADNDEESDLNLGWYSGVIGDDFDVIEILPRCLQWQQKPT